MVHVLCLLEDNLLLLLKETVLPYSKLPYTSHTDKKILKMAKTGGSFITFTLEMFVLNFVHASKFAIDLSLFIFKHMNKNYDYWTHLLVKV